MRFLTDQDVYQSTVSFLQGSGHDVVTAKELGLAQAADSELLQTAHAHSRIMVTRDRDYGNLVFAQGSGAGVIYLRILPSTHAEVHAEFSRVLSAYSETDLASAFVVIEPGRHRLRKVSTESSSS